ncbi:hypothetical protein J3Q64DRAFT_1844003, partial [Phycomyces blakesleeanus]
FCLDTIGCGPDGFETIGCGPDGFEDYWVRTRRFWRLLGADQTVLTPLYA